MAIVLHGDANFEIDASGNMSLGDGEALRLGDSHDFQLSHVANTNGGKVTGQLRFPDGSGAGGTNKLSFGDSDDFNIYHNAAGSYLRDSGTGAVIVRASELSITNSGESNHMARFFENSNVVLNHNGTTMFQTDSDGFSLIGDKKFHHQGWRGHLDRGWSDYPSITIDNTTDHGPQGEFRIHGMPGSNGGDFSIVTRCDGGYVSGSDERKKLNIEEITNALSTVKQLTGKKFNLIDENGEIDPYTTNKKFGLIAQECKDIIPEAVKYYENENTPNEKGWANAYAIDYPSLTALLINAIKELATKVEVLESK